MNVNIYSIYSNYNSKLERVYKNITNHRMSISNCCNDDVPLSVVRVALELLFGLAQCGPRRHNDASVAIMQWWQTGLDKLGEI